MKVLLLSPAVSRFDLTLHYFHCEFCAVFEYLRWRFPDANVNAVPLGLLGGPNRIIIDALLGEPDFVLIWARVWEVQAARQIAAWVRDLCPFAKVVVWGDGPLFVPRYFRRFPFDAAVVSGDAELVLADYVDSISQNVAPTHGLILNTADASVDTRHGLQLTPADWPFPALDVIDIPAYQRARAARGKETDDLSFDVSRGCHLGCGEWCVDPLKGGSRDRRRPVNQTVNFMRSGSLSGYDQFQLHGPIFTQDRAWLDDFVSRILTTGEPIPFSAVTLASHLLDANRVAKLASAGMTAVGFGVESLSASSTKITSKLPFTEQFDRIADNLNRFGVKGKAYVQLGLPGQRREDIYFTVERMLALGFTVRATGSTPFHILRRLSLDELDSIDLTLWDRKSFFADDWQSLLHRHHYIVDCGLTKHEFYQLILRPEEGVCQPA